MRKERNLHESHSSVSTTQTPLPALGRPRFSTGHPSRTEESRALASSYEAGVRNARTVHTHHHPCARVATSAWQQRSGGKRGIHSCEPHPPCRICRITARTYRLATFL